MRSRPHRRWARSSSSSSRSPRACPSAPPPTTRPASRPRRPGTTPPPTAIPTTWTTWLSTSSTWASPTQGRYSKRRQRMASSLTGRECARACSTSRRSATCKCWESCRRTSRGRIAGPTPGAGSQKTSARSASWWRSPPPHLAPLALSRWRTARTAASWTERTTPPARARGSAARSAARGWRSPRPSSGYATRTTRTSAPSTPQKGASLRGAQVSCQALQTPETARRAELLLCAL
mmetsp:Transcript_55271/g.161291  ORF Transcript_55271/g.161291 Transcript_55271/m.161291 type:complete len:235 (-) Transcript_55271:6-710(-)